MEEIVNTKKNIFGHKGFLLDKLILKNNVVFGKSFEIDFFDYDDLKKCNGLLDIFEKKI